MKVLLVDYAPIEGGMKMMLHDRLSALYAERVSPVVVADANSPMRGRFSATVPESDGSAQAGGATEIVLPDETGQLVPPGDVQALANVLRELAGDAGLRERLGQAGRARAEQEYALPVMAERFTRVWAKAAAR